MISIIVAKDKNDLIGCENGIPWKSKKDLRRFKKITTGHTIIMGRKTFESLNERPLPNRKNIVISRTKDYSKEGVITYSDLIPLLEKYENSKEEVFIIGGAKIYEQALPYAKKIYITEMNNTYEGDVFFPYFNLTNYRITYIKREQELSFIDYEKR